MDATTQWALWILRLVLELGTLALLGVGGWRYVRRRLSSINRQMDAFTTGATARDGRIQAMDERVRKLEAGQEAMHAEQIAQREILNRINTRLARQNDLLTELVPTVRALNSAEIARQVLGGLLAAQRAGTTFQGPATITGAVAGGDIGAIHERKGGSE